MSRDMAALATQVEWLRPLVNDHHWHYCVLWKFGDDPSSGAKGIRVKDENGLDTNHLIAVCKDRSVEHPIASRACRKLAQLPSLIPLYSGIHGDAVISQRPQWIIHSNHPSVSDDESRGTHVVIPIAWGLIELFTTEEVAIDEKIINYISAQFNVCDKLETMTETNILDSHNSSCLHIPNWLPSLNNLNLHPSMSQPNNSSFEGSSTCSSLSNELKLGSDHHTLTPENSSLKRKKQTDFAAKISQKGPYKSKNLITERKRRKKIKDGILLLRSIVPKITKMDKNATLGDAADYIKELQATIENYRDELGKIEAEDCIQVKAKQNPTSPIVVEIEVNQLGKKDFLVRLLCKQRPCGFTRLMEALNSLGLQVKDVNIATLNGFVLNIIKVEAKTTEVEVNTLKNSLVEQLMIT